MGAKSLVYQISTALVILVFGFAGTVKITPAISPDIHNEMVSTLACPCKFAVQLNSPRPQAPPPRATGDEAKAKH